MVILRNTLISMELAEIVECTNSLTYQEQGANTSHVSLMRSYLAMVRALHVKLITDLVVPIHKSVLSQSVLPMKYCLLMVYVHLVQII